MASQIWYRFPLATDDKIKILETNQ